MEFALSFPEAPRSEAVFWLLQIRPYGLCRMGEKVDVTEEEAAQALLVSRRAMGAAREVRISHLAYVIPERFDPTRTRELVMEVAEVNARMEAAGSRYVLMGPGRWGTADPFLGIPVKWHDIRGAEVLVETALDGFSVEPSEGSHFFHNLVSLNIACLTTKTMEEVDWKALSDHPAEFETANLRLLSFSPPLAFRLDRNRGVAVLSRTG